MVHGAQPPTQCGRRWSDTRAWYMVRGAQPPTQCGRRWSDTIVCGMPQPAGTVKSTAAER